MGSVVQKVCAAGNGVPVIPPVAKVSEEKEIIPGEPCLLRCYLESEDGQRITLVDYASAGRDWKTVIAAWLPTK